MTKEQMIDKMARMLCYQQDVGNCTECCRYNSCLYRFTAKEIYNAGFRKQSEGEWTLISNGHGRPINWKCSVCGYETLDAVNGDTDFCPNCGAKMKGADDDQQ